jgi:hypothetical protein
MFNESANKAYIKTQFEIEKELKKLQDMIATHNEQAVNINWGHVGDVKYILDQLKQLNGDES